MLIVAVCIFTSGNLNAEQKANILQLFEENWETFSFLSRRRNFEYCGKLNNNGNKNGTIKDKIKYYNNDTFKRSWHCNHFIFNSCNDTCEIRLFRGTLKKQSFLITCDLIFTICNLAKRNKDLTLKKVIKNLKNKQAFFEYVEERKKYYTNSYFENEINKLLKIGEKEKEKELIA